MGITPLRYIKDVARALPRPHSLRPHNNWMALSPLAVFLAVYLVSSIVAGDFYKVPVVSAFIIAAIYAISISHGGGSLERRVATFSEGAGNKNVLLMIWIFVLAGAFASTAKQIGAIDATVNLTTSIMPGSLLLAGMFVAACLVSMAVGTSVGTIAALMPIASGLAESSGLEISLLAAAITGGAFFGDNLSFISDTTIAATRTQGCSMSEKFKANFSIALPAALIACAIYVLVGSEAVAVQSGSVDIVKVVPYLAVIVMAVSGINVMVVLFAGIIINGVIGFVCGDFGWVDYLVSIGNGVASMGDLIIVTMLAGGVMEMIRYNGGIDFAVERLTARIKGRRGAQFAIGALVGLANVCTANNTIAIISTGGIAKNVTEKYGLRPRRTASILDTFSCIVQGILPYGAQLLMASALAGVGTISIIRYLFYPYLLFICACAAIVFFSGKKA